MWRRQREDGRHGGRGERQAREDLLRWLAAEQADDDDGAESALGSLFAALPDVEPPAGLTQRVLSATVWEVEPTASEVARGWWRAMAVLAGLAAVTLAAGGALAPFLVGLLDPAAAVAGSFESVFVVARTAVDWLATAANLAGLLSWLGSTALLVASSPEVVAAVAAGAALTALAIKVLHQVVERDRRHSYAEAN